MGFMDKVSKILGDHKPIPTTPAKGPAATLREHGIDSSDLKFSLNQDGLVAVSGQAQNQSESDRICEIVEGIPNVSGVLNKIVVAAPAP